MIAVVSGGAILGFLRFNSFPAQLFMGDCGSQMLGFVCILIAIKLTQQNSLISPYIPLVFFGLPVIDTVIVMVRRIRMGRNPFRADKNHFHHQILSLGLYHSEAVFVLYVVQSLFVIFVIGCYGLNDYLILLIYLFIATGIATTVFFSTKNNYRINRGKYIDRIKHKLRPLKDKGVVIKYSHRCIKIGVPFLFFSQLIVFLPIFEYSLVYLIIAFFIIILYHINGLIVLANSILFKVFFYFTVPFLILSSELSISLGFEQFVSIIINGVYVFLFLSILFTIKLTRIINGLKFSSLDFLIIFLYALIPLLPDIGIDHFVLFQTVTKTVIIYYGYEVLQKERRRNDYKNKYAYPIVESVVEKKLKMRATKGC
jgi:UDP-GlcNAc:undecaprenyl-phosphate GlcNAc-1-phosphate transferase